MKNLRRLVSLLRGSIGILLLPLVLIGCTTAKPTSSTTVITRTPSASKTPVGKLSKANPQSSGTTLQRSYPEGVLYDGAMARGYFARIISGADVHKLVAEDVMAHHTALNAPFNHTLDFTPVPAAALTPLAITAAAQAVIDGLNNLATRLGGALGIAANGAGQALSLLLDQLKQLVGDKIDKPLADLGENIQELARQIRSATTRLQTMLAEQQCMLLINQQVFIAGLESVAGQLHGVIPFTGAEAPKLYYFKFAGQFPNLVPQNGGSLDIEGFRLWEDDSPEVRLLDDHSNVIAELHPEKGRDTGSISVFMDPAVVRSYAGKCLFLKVSTREVKKLLWIIPIGHKIVAEMNLPICIPSSYVTTAKVYAHFEYGKKFYRTGTLEAKEFRGDNDSCENTVQLGGMQRWTLPKDGEITSLNVAPAQDDRNFKDAHLTVIGDSVTLSGWLDTASCVKGPFFAKELHSSIYHVMVSPNIRWPDEAWTKKDIAVDQQSISFPATIFRIPLPRDADDIDDYTISFKIVEYVNGVEQAPLFTSPTITTAGVQVSMPDQDLGKYGIAAEFVPKAGTLRSELSVSLNLSKCQP